MLHVALLQLYTNFIKFDLWLLSDKGNEVAAIGRERTKIVSVRTQIHVNRYVNKFKQIQCNIL